MPYLFPQDIGNENTGKNCIKIVTAAIFCNIAFSVLVTLNKFIRFIKARYLRRSAKIDSIQTSITSTISPGLKSDSFTK